VKSEPAGRETTNARSASGSTPNLGEVEADRRSRSEAVPEPGAGMEQTLARLRHEADTALATPRRRSVGPSVPIRDRLPWRTLAAALFALCLVGAGIGGYLIGNSPEVDLDAIRSAAAAAGREQGSERGAKEGYTQGYQAAQKRTFGSAYAAAYAEAYANEFESIGLDPPERIPVAGPR
jgi:hypothetical protein